MTKKILLIIGILAVVGVALFLIFGSKPQTEGESRVGFSLRDYLPFGNSADTETNNATTSEVTEEQPTGGQQTVVVNQPIPRLRKISKEPIAGAVVFNVGTTSAVRFVEKGTGNVYEVKSNSVAVERLTNTTIPKIIRAFWLPNGSGFIAQTIMAESEVVETSFVKLNKNKASSTSEILTPFGTTIGKLPTGIKEVAIKPDGAKIFYYTANNSYSSWFISNPDGTGASQLLTHPLTEWLPKWISANQIIMQSKGSSESVGYVYSFDTANKVLKKMGVGTAGISANTNTDGSLSLVSSGGSLPQMFLVDNKAVSSTKMSVNTLAEKCVWLKSKSPSAYCAIPNQIPSGNYPDVWYKGLVSTEDFLVKVDLNNDVYYNISDLSTDSDQKIDVIDLAISPNETHLIFRNKIDGYLWMLRIGE